MTAPLGVGRGGYLKHRQLHKLSIENKKERKEEIRKKRQLIVP